MVFTGEIARTTHQSNVREIQFGADRFHVVGVAVNDPAYAEETQTVHTTEIILWSVGPQ